MGLDGVELVMAIEDRFGLKLRDEEVQDLRTVAEVAALVSRKLELQAPPDSCRPTSQTRAFAEARVLDEVRRLTAEQLGLEIEVVRPESDFVRDLRMDR